GGGFEFDGKIWRSHLEWNDIVDTPSWAPADGEPPLSVYQASTAASLALKRFIGDNSGLEIRTIRLEHLYKGRWFYEVEFMNWDLPRDKYYFSIWVKMDGVVVEPTITPKEQDSGSVAR